MRLANVRLGHATNSSSAHSIVLLGKKVSDDHDGRLGANEYGWDCFTLGSAEAKAAYMRVAAFWHYKHAGLGDTEAALLSDVFGGRDFSTQELVESDIDHQSMPQFPRPVGKTDGMLPLWQWIKRHVIEPSGVAILGGNDNDGEHSLADAGPEVAVPWSRYRHGTYRWDPQGYIATYDPRLGTRLRWCMDDGTPPDKGTWPELMDLKITDCCHRGCSHCYQGSTPDGRHASIFALRDVAYSCKSMGTFELALGGGEPTAHPEFARILRIFREHAVTPNFSTGDTSWVHTDLARKVAEYCGSVALSVNSIGENTLERVENWLRDAAKALVPYPALHVILGMQSAPALQTLLRIADDHYARVVLLAYHGGRGRAKDAPPPDLSSSWQVVRESQTLEHGRLAVDSFLAAQVSEQIPDADPLSYEVGDGRFSMYYDAVTGIAAQHSHAPDSERSSVSPYGIERWWQSRDDP